MKRLTTLMAVFISLLFATTEAKTYYVSKFSGSSDGNTGLAWNAAWSTIAKINSATASGDTVVFGTGIWRGTTLIPVSGTAGHQTTYIDSLHFVATPTTYPTRRVAYLYGSDSLTGWSLYSGSGATSVYRCSYTPSSGYPTLWQGGVVLLGQTGVPASDGQFYFSGGYTYVRLAGGANPAGYDMEMGVRPAIQMSRAYFSQDYFSVVGLGMRYGDVRLVENDQSANNDFNFVLFDHCLLEYAAGWGGENPSLFYDDSPGLSNNLCSNDRIRACSLGTCYSWTGNTGTGPATYPQVEDISHGNAISLYSSSGFVIDSNVFYGHQSEAGVYFKNGSSPSALYLSGQDDTVRFNTFNTRPGLPYAIRIYGAIRGAVCYGNVINNAGFGVHIGYFNYGPGTEGSHRIFNNTFNNCTTPLGQYDVEGKGTYIPHRHDQFKYNICYFTNPTSRVTMLDTLVSNWDPSSSNPGIDSNLWYAASGTMQWGAMLTGGSIQYNTWAQWIARSVDVHSSSTVNPNFNNYAAGDFSRPSASNEMNRTYGGRTWAVYGATQSSQAPTPSITVFSPNGGESWLVSSSQTITWASQAVSGNVKIDYSTSSGSTWTAVTASTGNTGSFSWTTPSTASSTCLVKVSQLTGGTAADQSNAPFTITATPPSITVTSPNGGEAWLAGSVQSIVWTSLNVTGNVKVDYSTNSGSTWTAVTASTANSGSLAWTTPSTASSTCLVKVSQLTGGTAADQSNAVFSITSAPSSITVTSPNGGEIWAASSSHAITWSSQNLTGNVKIDYSTNAGSTWIAVSASTGNTGSCTWIVPNSTSVTCLVRASQVTGGTASDQSNANFIIRDSISPSAISNLAAGSATSTGVPLTWSAVGDDGVTGTATSYDVRYSTATITAANFSSATRMSAVPVPKAPGSAESFVVAGLTPGTAYYFAVKAADEVPNWGPVSNIASQTTLASPLAIPNLTSPANGSVGASTNPTLVWGASANATSYRIQVSIDPAFGSSIVDQSNIAATSVVVSGLANGTTYYWHVSASNGVGTSAFSAAWSLTTLALTPPVAPVLVSPGDGASSVALSPALSWNAVVGASSYRVQVSTSAAFSTTLIDQNGIAATSLVASGLANGATYYWRVSASNGAGASPFSTGWGFTTVVTALPIAPIPVSPANGATKVTTSPVLVWNASTNATSYRLQVSTSSTFGTTIVDKSGLAGTTYSLSGLRAFKTFYWRVKASNAAGNSAYSATMSFRTGWNIIVSAADSAAGTASSTESILPTEFSLGQNYPNPFNPTTRIEFALPEAGEVTLEVYNMLGQKVKTLANGQMAAGNHSVEWNSTGENGRPVASGVYLYRLTTSDNVVTKRMTLLK